MPEKIRWGILSSADIGIKALIPAIQLSRNGEVVAIASRSLKKGQQVAKEAGIPRAYGDYADLLADPEVDAIYNPLPNNLHVRLSVQAIEHGKHVLCEKPLAMYPSEIDELAAAVDEHGKIAMEALMYCFHPQTKRILQIVRDGTLGDPLLVAAAFTYNLPNPHDIRFEAALGGGVMYDVGSYCVSVARAVMGREPVLVNGRARFGPDSDVDEVFAGILTFADGAQATFGCCLHAPRDQWCKITGTEATLTVPAPFSPGSGDCTLILRSGWRRGRDVEEKIIVPGADHYQLMVEHFGDCIRSGRPPMVSLEESRANLVVVEALLRSACAGKPIEI